MSVQVKHCQSSIRLCLGLALWLFSSLSLAQSQFFRGVNPECTFVISKHSMGADMVEATFDAKKENEASIRQKLVDLEARLGTNVRGVQISLVDSFYKVNFATNGLINDAEPRLNLTAIAQSLAVSKPAIKQLSVFFSGITPSSSIPARWFAPEDAWLLEGVGTKNPYGIEYRIKLNTTDATKIYLPNSQEAKQMKAPVKVVQRTDYVLIGVLFLAAGAVGVLVYSLAIRSKSKKT